MIKEGPQVGKEGLYYVTDRLSRRKPAIIEKRLSNGNKWGMAVSLFESMSACYVCSDASVYRKIEPMSQESARNEFQKMQSALLLLERQNLKDIEERRILESEKEKLKEGLHYLRKALEKQGVTGLEEEVEAESEEGFRNNPFAGL